MPPKKITKKAKVSPVVKKIVPHDRHFLGVLVLFAGISVYAIGTFVSSNDNYIQKGFTSVLAEESALVHEDVAEVQRQNPFSDLNHDYEHFDAVVILYYEGIVSGYSNGTFGPENNVNRAEFSKMLVEASDLDYASLPPEELSLCFTDVRDLPEHWFAPAVCAAKNQGWVGGYENGGFSPNQNINRAEALKILLNAFDFEVSENSETVEAPYPDVNMNDWFLGVAAAAKENEIVRSTGSFSAGNAVTRGQISQMIYNAMRAKGLL